MKFPRYKIKFLPLILSSAIVAVAPILLSSKAIIRIDCINQQNKTVQHSINSVDTVFERFLNDVTLHHQEYLNKYIQDYKNMPKSSLVDFYSCTRSRTSQFMHWDENSEWDHIRKRNTALDLVDNNDVSFTSEQSKPRLLSSQSNNLTIPFYVPKCNLNEKAIDLGTHSGNGFGQPWMRMINDWTHAGNYGDWQNYLNDMLVVTRAYKNVNFDTVNIKFRTGFHHHGECKIINGPGERRWEDGWWNEFDHAVNFTNMLPIIMTKHFHNGETWAKSCGWGAAYWYLKLCSSNSFNITYWTYSLNNLFQIKDFGYDSTDGYYYTLGLNDLYLQAVEAEKLNPEVNSWWTNELVGKNRLNWIPDFSKTQPAFEKIRDQFFNEVQKLINHRVITYDNYFKVRKYVHDISAQSRQCPAENWLTKELQTNIDLQNNGWPSLSKTYEVENCPNIWNILVTLLPQLHYTIHFDRNSNPDNVSGGEWEDLKQHQDSYDWNALVNRVKIPLGYDGKNSVAFKAEVDVITEQNKSAPFNVDTWRGNFNSKNEPIDTNLTNNLLPIDFIFDKTVQLETDPKNEHKDHKDTYWHFDKNMKKLCNVQNEPNKKLNMRNDCSETLPSVMWNTLSGTSSEKIKQIVIDENGTQANVFAYKNIQGEFDYNIKDEYLKVIPDDKEGKLIIRLINPTTQAIVSTTELTGFLKDEGYSDIKLPFGKLFSTMTGKTTENIQVEVLNPKADTTLEYSIEDDKVATVTKTDNTGRIIKISGISYGITKVKVLLKDSGSMVLSTTDFWIYVDIKPEAMDINQPFTDATITEGTTGVAEEGKNFSVEVFADKEKKSKECLQYATYRLINAPEWIGISNSAIWEDPESGEIHYLEPGYIYVNNAQVGTYVFTVEATNCVDETLKVTSKNIVLKVNKIEPVPPTPPTPEKAKLSAGAIAAIACSSVAGAGIIGGFTTYAVKRRKK